MRLAETASDESISTVLPPKNESSTEEEVGVGPGRGMEANEGKRDDDDDDDDDAQSTFKLNGLTGAGKVADGGGSYVDVAV